MIFKQLQDFLTKMNVKEVESLGAEFDPNVHNAIQQLDGTDYASNYVCQVYQKGYMIGDKLWERFNASKEDQSWYYSKFQDALEDLQFYEESRGFYWEFVDKFKDVFVRFYFYEFEEAVYMVSLDGEGYMFTSRETEAVPFTGEIPADAAQITRKYAERLQDNWLEGDFYMNQGMYN